VQHRARQAATNTAALTGLQARAAMSTISLRREPHHGGFLTSVQHGMRLVHHRRQLLVPCYAQPI
jgi:hypothetical protein